MLADRERLSASEAQLSDAEIVAAGDPEQFTQLYDRYVDHIYRYCRLRLANPADAEDATAIVFTKAFAAFPPAPTGSFRSWLFTIAHNVIVNEYRSRRNRGPTHSIDALGELRDQSPTPEEAAVRTDEADMLRRALKQLPADQQRVVELRLAGLTGAEIAETLGKSNTAIRMSQFRAMHRLRELLIAPHPSITEEKRHAR